MKNRIIYIGNFELPDKNAAANRVLSNAKIFSSLGYETTFIGKSNVDYCKINSFNFSFDLWSRFPTNNFFGKVFEIFFSKRLSRILKKHENIFMIIAYNLDSLSLYKLIKFARKRKIIILGDITEWYESKNLIKGIDTFLRMNWLNHKMDGLICVSSFLSYFYNKTTNIIVPPLVDLNEDKWNIIADKNRENIIKLVYFGSPGYHKDKINKVLDFFINTKNNKLILTIIGISIDDYLKFYPEHKLFIRELKNVNFIKRLSHQDTLKEVKNSDFSLIIRENKRVNNAGFPTKFVESFTLGVPCISTKISDIGLYLLHEKNGIIIDFHDTNFLKILLGLDNKKLNMYKVNLDNENPFDYKKYILHFKFFFDKILNK
jgi:glycosyltransferase involved in cell wall biosynthesis